MKRLFSSLLTCGMVIAAGQFWANPSFAQDNNNSTVNGRNNVDNTGYGTTSAQFLSLGAGARGTALGSSYASLATDVSALYYNPGAIAALGKKGAMLSKTDYVAGTHYLWAGTVTPINNGQSAFGIAVANFGFANQPVYTEASPNGDGSFYSVSETSMGVSYGYNFSDRFSAGMTGKLIVDQLGKTTGNAVAFDFGTYYRHQFMGRPFHAAFTVVNLGNRLKAEGNGLRQQDFTNQCTTAPDGACNAVDQAVLELRANKWLLPSVFRFGMAWDAISTKPLRGTIMGDFGQPNDSKPTYSVGGELAADHISGTAFSLAARGSWTARPDLTSDVVAYVGTGIDFNTVTRVPVYKGNAGRAFGAGFGYDMGGKHLTIDWAVKQLGELGSAHTYTLNYAW